MRSRNRATIVASVACLLALSSPACAPAPAPDRFGARALATPTGPDSGQPGLVVAGDGRLYLSWVEPTTTGHALRFAVSENARWSQPRTIAEGGDWFVNWADVPAMTAAADGTLAAHWLARSGASTYAYDVWLAVSRDGGASWTEPVRAHDDLTQTEHGFASLVPGPAGFDVVWLDGRRTANDPPGPMTLRHAVLDFDGRLTAGTEVDDRVCDCCPTAAARADDGTLVLAWRDRSEGEIRDIHIARLETDGWAVRGAIHDDGWWTEGCPVNGPAIAAGPGVVAVAWFTMGGGSASVRIAFSADGGRSFGAPVGVDDGAPIGRVGVVVLEDGSAQVSWLEQAGDAAEIRVRGVRQDGQAEPSHRVAGSSESRASGYPRLARYRGETVVAWTEVGEPGRVRTGVVQ